MLTTHSDLIAHKWAKVTCEIQWVKIDDAMIQVEDWFVFICQNEKNWLESKEKLWYKYSWCVSNQDNKYEEHDRYCTNIQLVGKVKKETKETKKETYETIIRRNDWLEFKKGMIGEETIEQITARRKSLLQEAAGITALLKKYNSLNF